MGTTNEVNFDTPNFIASLGFANLGFANSRMQKR